MGLHNDQVLETWKVGGVVFVVMHEQSPGLWWIVERDSATATPILRHRIWIESGQMIDPLPQSDAPAGEGR